MASRHDEVRLEDIEREQAETLRRLQRAVDSLPVRLEELGATVELFRDEDILEVAIGALPDFFYTLSGNGEDTHLHFDATSHELVGITVEGLSQHKFNETHEAFQSLMRALSAYGKAEIRPRHAAAAQLANDLRELVPA
jgi:hypothetical protein